jgi:hypothetical protein
MHKNVIFITWLLYQTQLLNNPNVGQHFGGQCFRSKTKRSDGNVGHFCENLEIVPSCQHTVPRRALASCHTARSTAPLAARHAASCKKAFMDSCAPRARGNSASSASRSSFNSCAAWAAIKAERGLSKRSTVRHCIGVCVVRAVVWAVMWGLCCGGCDVGAAFPPFS